jgi:hypothetical protein
LGEKKMMEEGGKNGGGRMLLWDEVGARTRIKWQVSEQGWVARKGSIRFLMQFHSHRYTISGAQNQEARRFGHVTPPEIDLLH